MDRTGNRIRHPSDRTLSPLQALAVLAAALLSLLLYVLRPALAAATVIVLPPPDRPPAPRERWIPTPPPIERPWQGHVVPEDLALEIKIRDGVATTDLREEIRNPTDHPIEAQFVLPIPRGATVHDAALRIGGQLVEAEIMEAGQARRAYEDIVRRCIDPALVEHLDDGLLRTRVFPVPPRGSREIQLTLTLSLPEDFGVAQYSFPLRFVCGGDEGPRRVSVSGTVDSARPLEEPYSPTHDLDVTLDRDGRHARFSLQTTGSQAGARDLQIFLPTRSHGLTITAASTRPPGDDGFVLLRISPGEELDRGPSAPRQIVFVLDTSGSMQGEKLEQAQHALAGFLQGLDRRDRFAVITYASTVTAWSEELQPADHAHVREALDQIETLRAGGGTNIGAALDAALDLAREPGEGPAYVLFLTDGQPTVGVTGVDDLLAKVDHSRRARARLFSFGVGTDVNTRLLDGMASATGALARYVLPGEDLEVAVGNLCAQITDPLWTDLELRLAGAGLHDLVPDALPDLFRGQTITVLARYRRDGRFDAVLSGLRQGDRRRETLPIELARRATIHGYLPQLWAGRRIASLQAALRAGGDRDELIREIVDLGTRYGIVTEYTSFLMREPDPQLAASVRQRLKLDLPKELAQSLGSVAQPQSGDLAVRSAARDNRLMESKSLAQQDALEVAASAPQASASASGGSFRSPTAAAPSGWQDGRGAGAKRAQSDERRIDGRIFRRDERGRWIDRLAEGATPRLKVVAFSQAYFELLQMRPDLGSALSVGPAVVLAAGREVIEIGAAGISELDDAARAWLRAGNDHASQQSR
jgi:Ca-activated chloride channel family protein